jgi:hypothetical protein
MQLLERSLRNASRRLHWHSLTRLAVRSRPGRNPAFANLFARLQQFFAISLDQFADCRG